MSLDLLAVHEQLLDHHGPQHWWPAEDAFEIIVGALLVQRTTWRNAELAIAEIRRHAALTPSALAGTKPGELEQWVRSAGFYRSKAARLRQLAARIVEHGGVEGLAEMPTRQLRGWLIDQEGVGDETADAILLYAFDRPTVVIDAYLRRFVARVFGTSSPASDDDIRAMVESEITGPAALNEFHALIVAHGKQHCRQQPRCQACVLAGACATGRSQEAAAIA